MGPGQPQALKVANPQHQEGNSAPSSRPFTTRLAGTAIVLACLILPFVLWRLAIWTEDTAKDGYVRALQGTLELSPAPASFQLIDQHYYFVNGCVAPPGECNNANADSWGEYYDELRTLYEQAVQTAASRYSQPFEEWSQVHAHFINSLDASDGAYKIARSLQWNNDGAAVHMVGTSAGGSAIFTYSACVAAIMAPIVLNFFLESEWWPFIIIATYFAAGIAGGLSYGRFIDRGFRRVLPSTAVPTYAGVGEALDVTQAPERAMP